MSRVLKFKKALEEGKKQFAVARYENAINDFNSALKLAPNSREVLNQITKAKTALTVAQSREKISAAIQKGYNEIKNTDFDKAYLAFQEVLKVDPVNIEAQEGLKKAKKAQQLNNYLGLVLPIVKENKTLEEYFWYLVEGVNSSQISPSDANQKISEEIMPRRRDLLKQVNNLKIAEEFNNIHKDLVMVIQLNLKVVNDFLVSIIYRDIDGSNAAKEILNKASDAEERYKNQLDRLSHEVGLQ